MPISHFEFLLEEPSMEAFLSKFLPRVLPTSCTFGVHAFQGKKDLLSKLEDRLRGYAQWLPSSHCIVVVVDRDNDDCRALKGQLDEISTDAGLLSKSSAPRWQIVSRIAIEELESWYFGDWEAVHNVYPKVPQNIPKQAKYRDPDQIQGGTWEALERILQRHGYFIGGLRKRELGQKMGESIDASRIVLKVFRLFIKL